MKIQPQKALLLRFLGAILVPALLLALSISFGLQNIHQQYLFSQKELLGTQAVHQLFNALTDLQKIRELSRILPWDKTPNLEARRHAIIDEFTHHFKTPEWRKASNDFALDQEMAPILLGVLALHDTKTAPVNDRELFKQYTAIIDKITSLILVVADRSNLILDPELDTYYLMEIAVKQIPDLSEAFAAIRGLGSGMLAQANSTREEKILFQEKISIIRDQLRKFARTKSIIREASSATKLSFEENDTTLNQITASFSQTCKALEEDRLNLTAEDFFQQGSEVIDLLAATFNATTDMLQSRLNQRLINLRHLLLVTLMTSVITLVAIFVFSLSFYRLQRASLRELERISKTETL